MIQYHREKDLSMTFFENYINVTDKYAAPRLNKELHISIDILKKNLYVTNIKT
jgi:hypothetical protein